MDINLRNNQIGKNLATIANNRDRGFIARGFNT